MAVNLADPDVEPTDEELQQLSKDAFADVAERNRARFARTRAQIRAARAEALARLDAMSESGER